MKFRIRPDLHAMVRGAALLEGVNVSEIVSRALASYFLEIEEAWIVEKSSMVGVESLRDEVMSEGV